VDNSRNKKIVLFITSLGSFLTPFMSSSINIILPLIGKEFAIDVVLVSWIAVSYLLATAIFLVPFGKIADIKGRKKIFSYGIIIYTLSSFLVTLSRSIFMLIFLRILQGIGSAMIFATAIAILTSAFPAKERGKVLGINAAVVYSGLSLGPFLGGFLAEKFNWRSLFFLNAFLGLLTIIFIFWKLKDEGSEEKKENFDFVGSFIYSLAILMIIYGFSLAPERLGLFLVFLGILGIAAFAKWEEKIKNPVLDINLFKNNKTFAFSNLAALINYSTTFAVGFLLSLYLQYLKGLNPQTTGLILLAQPLVMIIFSPLAGKISDQIEPRIIASLGMFCAALGLFFFIFLTEKTKLNFIIINLILMGLGNSFFASPNTNAIMNSVENKFYGIASGMIGTMRLIGQMLSMAIAMLIFTISMGKTQIAPENYLLFLEGTKKIFFIFTLLCLVGIFVSFYRTKNINSIKKTI